MALDSVLSTPIIPPPPKAPASSGAAKSSSGSSDSASSSQSSGATGSSSSASSGASGSSKSSSSDSAAKTSGKGSAAHSSSSTQSKNASASQAKQDAASSKTQSANSAANANGKSGATQPGKPTGPSFIQTLAQSQAEAAIGVDAAATAAPEEVTGGKPKAAAGDDDTDPSSASFAFLSQSLAAAMAGVQPATQGQSAAAGASPGNAADGVSLTSGTSVQSLVANLTKGVADELKAPVASTDDPSGDAATNSAPTADNSASAANAFQAHMSVSSHFQAATDTVSDKIGSRVGSAAFNDEVGGKITWMANQGVQSASLQLSPEHMGPVDVRISMQDGSASVAFSAAHADTRAALEQALPRLREMFASQGMSLTDASVSQQSPRGQAQKQAVAAIGAVGGVGDDSTSTTTSIAAVAGARPGLVDLYA